MEPGKEKYLSIITNFGCHFQCPYCIVRNNHIDVPKTTMRSLAHLKEAIESEEVNIISVSGGGDPLFNYDKNKKYYRRLFKVCKEMNIPLEMHTTYQDTEFPYDKCYRVVYHCQKIGDLLRIQKRGREIVRAVFVVTEDFTRPYINEIASLVESGILDVDELTFRQMIDRGYRVTNYCQDYLREGHKKRWWYVEQNDYNPYFVNGTIYYKFSEIGS